MLNNQDIPKSANVLILGGGIHGVGVLHDLASRGIKNLYLIEKNMLGSGTSSKSTKLIHGGLRYLQRLSQISMVYESLQERKFLLHLAPEIVKPIEILIPIMKNQSLNSIKIKAGLTLYDLLAKKSLIKPHKKIDLQQAKLKAPILNRENIQKIYSYWDAQTDDYLLVKKIACSAVALGGKILEKTEVNSINNKGSTWELSLSNKTHQKKIIQANYVINCLGPWSNKFLEKNKITPTHIGKNNKGAHIIVKDCGLKSGLLLKAIDNRIFFILPWQNKTLIGTTEKEFNGDPNQIRVTQEEINYLLESSNQYLTVNLEEDDIESSFAGLRWLASEEKQSLTRTSRESIIGKIENKNGFILTIYGGKLTSYRRLCEKIGDLIANNLNQFTPSKTTQKEYWI